MKADGAVHLDYSIVCAHCGKLLRTIGGRDLEEIHTDSEGEDVCADCCDVCEGDMLCYTWTPLEYVPGGLQA